MGDIVGIDGGEVTMDQAPNAPIMVPVRPCDWAPQGVHPKDVVDRFTDRPVWIRGVGLGLDSLCTSTSTI